MALKRDEFYIKAAWLCIFGFTLFRFAYSGSFLLVPDEAYYWQWSRYMAWGYYDHPPMIAWAIKFATTFLGHTEYAVRLPSVFSMTIASIYLVLIAKRWISPLAAFNTAILSQSILLFNVGGILATPDSLQAVAWAGACFHVLRAYDDGKLLHWILGGAWFGFGMLSKYSMLIFLPCGFLFGIFSTKHRKRLTNIWPYTGVVLGTIMFLPVILWNAENGWITFRHVAYKGGVNQQFGIHLKYLGEYIASQAGLLSPVVFMLIIIVWFYSLKKEFRNKSWISTYLFFTSFPVFASFALLSLHSRVEGNWAGMGYLTASILISEFVSHKPKKDQTHPGILVSKKLFPWAIGSSYLITALIMSLVLWPILPIPPRLDRISKETSGWQILGQRTNKIIKEMPNPEKTFVFGLNYQTASELAFYMPGNPRTVSINKWRRPNAYEYWWKDEELLGWDAVGIYGGSERHRNRLKQIFERVAPPIKISIFRSPVFLRHKSFKKPVKSFYLYRAFGFKGGLKWVPPNKSDIRAN